MIAMQVIGFLLLCAVVLGLGVAFATRRRPTVAGVWVLVAVTAAGLLGVLIGIEKILAVLATG